MGTGFGPCSSAIFGVPGWEDTLASSFEEAIGLGLLRDVIYAKCQFSGSRIYVRMTPAHTPAIALYTLSGATTQLCLPCPQLCHCIHLPSRLLDARMQRFPSSFGKKWHC